MTEREPTFGAEWSASLRLGTDAELRGWLEVAQAACDEADAIARGHFRRDLHIETKPDRTFVTEADTAIEARSASGSWRPSPTTASSARSTARKRATPRSAGTSTRSTGPTTSSAACRCSARSWASSATASCRRRSSRRRPSASAGGRIAVAAPGPGTAATTTARGGSRTQRGRPARRTPRSCTAAAATSWRPVSRRASTACSTRVWRERGFGDFWGYTLLAEGAAEAMVEVGLNAWDAAAPIVLVEEAGGRVTDFDGRRGLDVGSFLAIQRPTSRDHPRAGSCAPEPERAALAPVDRAVRTGDPPIDHARACWSQWR